MMSQAASNQFNHWQFSFGRLMGWLVGVFTAMFGGLMYVSPGATVLGVPHVIVLFGICISTSYAIAMSSTCVSRWWILLLVAASLALMGWSRYHAPVLEVLEAIRTGKETLQKPGVLGTFAVPLMLLGLQVLQLVVPWLRDPQRMNWVEGAVSITLIQVGAISLFVGAILTAKTRAFEAQPYWVWLAVPLCFAVGTGLRKRWRGWDWAALSLVTGAALPVLWLFLRDAVN